MLHRPGGVGYICLREGAVGYLGLGWEDTYIGLGVDSRLKTSFSHLIFITLSHNSFS